MQLREITDEFVSCIFIFNILFCSILIAFSWSETLYAHNGISTSIPIATHKITLDGYRTEEAWKDASKFNFSSARPCCEGNVSTYLQYELTENSLSGSFFIPDKTPIDDDDQIAFLFDTNHSALNTIGSDAQSVVFIRNGTSEYYIGDGRQGDYKIAENVTLNRSDNGLIHPPMTLESPFSKTDFVTLSGNESWQGEFKIYFKESPRKDMGFSVSQVDFKTPNKSDRYFINYPKTSTSRADIPSSWGDIIFPRLDTYIENSKRFCPTVAPIYSTDKVVVLCSALDHPSIEEDEDDNVVKVSGALANVINGTGINDTLSIDINNEMGFLVFHKTFSPLKNGKFTETPETKDLKSGRYEIMVQPESGQYSKLVSKADLTVNPHALTVQEFGAFIGIAATAIGIVAFLPQIRNHFKGNKQTQNMVKELGEINSIYDKLYEEDSHGGQPLKASETDKEQAVHDLRQKRDNALAMLQNNQISQEQYGLLDIKISEYTSKLLGGKRAP